MKRRSHRGELRFDLKCAVRYQMRHAGISAAIVVTLALALAASAVNFGAIDQLLLQVPDGVGAPGDMVRVYFSHMGGGADLATETSYPQFALMGQHSRSLRLAAYVGGALSLGVGERARPVSTAFVSGDYFGTLEVQPVRGRVLSRDDDTPPLGRPVAVVSYRFWRARLRGEARAVGTLLNLNGRPYTIVGIAPPEFQGIDAQPVDVWLPLSVGGSRLLGPNWDFRPDATWLHVIGRLRPSATRARAAEELTAYVQRLEKDRGVQWTTGVRLGPLTLAGGPSLGLQARVLLWVTLVSLAVLLIACANVANLYVARLVERRRELAIRVAIGASRWRLLRQQLLEALLLAGAGGALGYILASVVSRPIQERIFGVGEVALRGGNWHLAVFTGGALLAAAMLAVLPALHRLARDRAPVPWTGAAMSSGGRLGAIRSALLVLQIALTVVLLIGASLFSSSFLRANRTPLGFDARHILAIDAPLDELGYSAQQEQQIYERVATELAPVPSVVGSSIATSVPFVSGTGIRVRAEDGDPYTMQSGELPYISAVTPGYFAALGIRLQSGRVFREADNQPNAERVAIINRTMARRLWLGGESVGRCLHIGRDDAPCTRVVGLVDDSYRDAIGETPSMQLFVPLAFAPASSGHRVLLVRTMDRTNDVVPIARRTIQRIEPRIAYPTIQPLAELLDRMLRPWRVGAWVLAGLGGLALLIAGVGVFSLFSHSVVERFGELGVRMALGATPASIMRLVVWRGLGLCAVGAILGLTISAVLDQRAAGLLYQTSPWSPIVYGTVAVGVLGIAACALAVPARRAARTDPSRVLQG